MKYYLVWKCVPSSELRGRKAGHDNGCNEWNMRGTNKSDYIGMQAECGKCQMRRRINRGANLFLTHEDAYCYLVKEAFNGGDEE